MDVRVIVDGRPETVAIIGQVDRQRQGDVPGAPADNSSSHCLHPGPECESAPSAPGKGFQQWIAALHGRCVLVSPTGRYSAQRYL